MPRVEDIASQESIGWTLVGENAEQEAEQALQQEQAEGQSAYAVPGRDLLDEAIAEQQENHFVLGDEGVAYNESRNDPIEREQIQVQQGTEQVEQPEQPEQPHAPTPEEVQAGVESLEKDVKEYGLNEPADARQFADEFCGAFGSDTYKAGVDVESLGGVMAKTAVSALRVYANAQGDLSQIPDIPIQNAQAFAHDFLKGMGLDPWSVNVDAMLLARVTLGGMMNFLHTYDSYGGKVTDLAKLNDPRQAEFYLQNFLRAFGYEGPVNRDAAIKFADACGRQVLRVLGKISQAQRAGSQPRGKAQRGQRIPAHLRDGIKGSKVPKFRSNADIFSGEAVEAAMSQKL